MTDAPIQLVIATCFLRSKFVPTFYILNYKSFNFFISNLTVRLIQKNYINIVKFKSWRTCIIKKTTKEMIFYTNLWIRRVVILGVEKVKRPIIWNGWSTIYLTTYSLVVNHFYVLNFDILNNMVRRFALRSYHVFINILQKNIIYSWLIFRNCVDILVLQIFTRWDI